MSKGSTIDSSQSEPWNRMRLVAEGGIEPPTYGL